MSTVVASVLSVDLVLTQLLPEGRPGWAGNGLVFECIRDEWSGETSDD